MLSIKILWESCSDVDPKTSVSLDESLNGSRQSAALKRRSVNGLICLKLLSFSTSLMIKFPVLVRGQHLLCLWEVLFRDAGFLLWFQSELVFDMMF